MADLSVQQSNDQGSEADMHALQVPCLVRMSQEALAEGKCVVIGLQSTGEARTADAVAKQGDDLDDFVSSPKVPTAIGMMHHTFWRSKSAALALANAVAMRLH